MTVGENIGFGPKMRSLRQAEIASRVAEAARILRISDDLDRRTGQLSGGQRQRVPMGRAIVRSPQGFLFDEPLSNLDAKIRVEVRSRIKRLHAMLDGHTATIETLPPSLARPSPGRSRAPALFTLGGLLTIGSTSPFQPPPGLLEISHVRPAG